MSSLALLGEYSLEESVLEVTYVAVHRLRSM